MLSVAPAFFLKIINSGEATENFILLPILVIRFKVDPCSHKLKILIYSLICREIRMALTVMNVVFLLLLSLFPLGKVKQVPFEFLKCLSQEFFFINSSGRVFQSDEEWRLFH